MASPLISSDIFAIMNCIQVVFTALFFALTLVNADNGNLFDKELVKEASQTIASRAAYQIATVPNPQVPCVWDALKILKGSKSTDDSYPQLADIPSTNFNCGGVSQAGFYADQQTGCQVVRRCDLDGGLSSYLCPNQTIFNQITLICDWWYNVDCSLSAQFQSYSNLRLYHPSWVLLDDCEGNSKPGTCPVHEPFHLEPGEPIGPCITFCFTDGQCPGAQKCCGTPCGTACMPPIYSGSSTTEAYGTTKRTKATYGVRSSTTKTYGKKSTKTSTTAGYETTEPTEQTTTEYETETPTNEYTTQPSTKRTTIKHTTKPYTKRTTTSTTTEAPTEGYTTEQTTTEYETEPPTTEYTTQPSTKRTTVKHTTKPYTKRTTTSTTTEAPTTEETTAGYETESPTTAYVTKPTAKHYTRKTSLKRTTYGVTTEKATATTGSATKKSYYKSLQSKIAENEKVGKKGLVLFEGPITHTNITIDNGGHHHHEKKFAADDEVNNEEQQ